jgi:putative transposase
VPRPQRNQKSLPAIWRAPDDLWSVIERVLAELDPPARTGRKRIDARSALDAIIFRLRSGCQWNRLPREFPDDSSVHRTFQRWVRLGVFDRIWAVLLKACEDLGGCEWEWQAADTAMGKARYGGDLVGPNPTDRAKPGVKRSLLVEAEGGPLGVAVASANVPDAQLLATTIQAIVVERPEPDRLQHLCLDKAYDNKTGWSVIVDYDYEAHIQLIRDLRTPPRKRYQPRRWVVERTLAWLSRCRAILIRWDKKAANYLGLLKLACTLIWFRRHYRLALSSARP